MQAVQGRPAQAPPPPPALLRPAGGHPSPRRPPSPSPPRPARSVCCSNSRPSCSTAASPGFAFLFPAVSYDHQNDLLIRIFISCLEWYTKIYDGTCFSPKLLNDKIMPQKIPKRSFSQGFSLIILFNEVRSMLRLLQETQRKFLFKKYIR